MFEQSRPDSKVTSEDERLRLSNFLGAMVSPAGGPFVLLIDRMHYVNV